ncbi:MAG: FecR domain-containing protein [Rhizobiaceae bacterium]|nr:FecR domain-containing protein [Hyphomicrobiales bacterium]NRB31620.1 FecR domain-containing protein [Rhizobiaceae bacterium]
MFSASSRFSLSRLAQAVAVCASLVLLSPEEGWAAPTVGTTAAVKGDVRVVSGGASRKAQVRSSIQLNDEVQTQEDSTMQIMLLDQTTLTVGENCSMIIDEFIYDPNGPSGSLGAQVLTGAFRYMSGQIAKANPQAVNITTPSSTIGIRGTILEGIVGEDAIRLAEQAGVNVGGASQSGATLTILRGPGSGANTLDEAGVITISSGGLTTEILQPGFFVFTPGPGEPPLGPFPVTDEMLAYLDGNLRDGPSGPSENPVEVGNAEDESGQDLFENDVDGGGTDPLDDGNGDDGGGDDGLEDGFQEMEEEEEDDAGGGGGGGAGSFN